MGMLGDMWKSVRPYVRGGYRVIDGVYGFLYDIYRYCRYGGWRGDLNNYELRNYSVAMAYHGLEKSLSYSERKPNSGWNNAYRILEHLKRAKSLNEFGYHDVASIRVLNEFLNLPENIDAEKQVYFRDEMQEIMLASDSKHGAMEFSKKDFENGVLEDPEKFFNSRYSLREFSKEIVPDDVIQRAVKLAMKTPSVCNRQAWGVYHTAEEDVKRLVLSYQEGNKPFGDGIPNIMVVTSDLKAFFSGNEHYQHWIDGGLLSMSLIYAFHSLGIATCPLNWSQTPKRDMMMRRCVNIKKNHTIIMVLAIGYPNDDNRVCVSARRPVDEVYTKLERCV